MFIIEDGVEVPESALLRVERDRGYGTVPGLEDEEPISIAELEHQIYIAEHGPLLAIPYEPPKSLIRPTIDENGRPDWGAFGTWDYERLRGTFNKAGFVADKLQKELRWAIIMLGIVQERLTLQARVEVLARLKAGVDLDDIDDHNEYTYARWYLRALKLRLRIRSLRAASRRHRLAHHHG